MPTSHLSKLTNTCSKLTIKKINLLNLFTVKINTARHRSGFLFLTLDTVSIPK